MSIPTEYVNAATPPLPTNAHRKSSQCILDPVYSAVRPTPSTVPPSSGSATNDEEEGQRQKLWCLYGEGELECHCLSLLKWDALKAQLKSYHPGTFRIPSRRGWFRCLLPKVADGEGDDEVHLVRIRSNSTRVSVSVNNVVMYESEEETAAGASHELFLDAKTLRTETQQYLLVQLVTSDIGGDGEEVPDEPPCLLIEESWPLVPLSETTATEEEPGSLWEWSGDKGVTWSRARACLFVDGDSFPHLSTMPCVHIRPRKHTGDGLYDFGVELLGKIVLSCAGYRGGAGLDVTANPPILHVGETITEAMNDDPEHQEQSTALVPIRESDAQDCWASVNALAFRYVRVQLGGASERDDIVVTCQAEFHPVQYHGAFAASDDLLNRIWMSASYTLRLCVRRGLFVDGIKRDRLPWAGDLAVSLLSNAYTFGDAEIVSASLTALGSAGITESVGDINGIVDYSLWWIISQDLFQLYFGDRSHLRREYGRIKEALSTLVARCNDAGFLQVDAKKTWLFVDWVDVEKTTALQILWWHALGCGVKLARRLEDGDAVSKWRKQQADLRAQLCASCWDDGTCLWLAAPNVAGEYSRHANILAAVFELTPKERCGPIRDALNGKVLPAVGTPYMKFFECLALSQLGANRVSLNTVRSYWGGMLEKGATTFWEAFNPGEDQDTIAAFYDRPYGRSLCHAWSSGPCHFLPETILGIRPLADGWREWSCNPQLDGLDWVSATVPTPRGCVEVDAKKESLRVVVPGGTTVLIDKLRYTGPQTLDLPLKCESTERCTAIDDETLKEWSAPYRGWHYHPNHVIPSEPKIEGFKGVSMTDVPTVYQLPEDKKFYMSFIGFDGRGYQSFVAESENLIKWTNISLAMGFGQEGDFDFGGVVLGAYLYEDYNVKAPRVLKKRDGRFWSLYGAYSKQGGYEIDPGYEGVASSEDGITWHRAKDQSILSVHDADVGDWEQSSIYQPWLVEHDGIYYNFYNAKRMPEWIEQIGQATSKDLLQWRRHPRNPVVRVRPPDGYDANFAADGKVFRDGDHWVMFYFGVDQEWKAHILVAFSKDLHHWTADPNPLYKAGGNPSGLDENHAHKISLVWDDANEMWFMFYDAVGNRGRGIGLLTSKPFP